MFYGENGVPTLKYQIDAYHGGWRCGLEVEAGRGWMGNAVYRSKKSERTIVSSDYRNAVAVAAARPVVRARAPSS